MFDPSFGKSPRVSVILLNMLAGETVEERSFFGEHQVSRGKG